MMGQGRFENLGSRLIGIRAAALRVHEFTDSGSRPQRGDTVALCGIVKRQFRGPCTGHRVAANTHPIARAKCVGRTRFDRHRFTEIKVGHDRRIRINDDAARPFHFNVSDLTS